MNTRLKELRKKFGFRQIDMANILGIRQNAYSNIENGLVSLTDRNATLLSEKLGVDKNWLLDSKNKSGVFFDINNTDFEKRLKKVSEELRQNTIKGTNELITNIIETRPRIPYTAAAGSLTSAVEGVTPGQCEQIPRITAFPNYDFTIIIKGNSMEPKYEGGDEVACKRIDCTSFIQWGKVHVLDTAQGIIIKRVYEDGDNIRCASYNPEYPDFSISKDEIYSMSLVVGLIRL